MAGRECYHCKQWVNDAEAHDCWTTTEAALTRDLAEDLKEAWERLRETAADFGDQRIYASHKSIMFSRSSCYFFVRPKRSALEVCVFLGHTLKAPQIRRVDRASKSRVAHTIHIRHRDEVEPPITDWLLEAYRMQDEKKPASRRAGSKRTRPTSKRTRPTSKRTRPTSKRTRPTSKRTRPTSKGPGLRPKGPADVSRS